MRRWGSLVAVLAALAALAGPTYAAEPAAGTVSATQPETSWTGGPFLAPNPLGPTDCPIPKAPYCDTFTLNVGPLPSDGPDVAVSVAADRTADLLSVAIYGPTGAVVARSQGLGSSQTVLLTAPPAGAYSVRVELLLGTPGVSTYKGRAVAFKGNPEIDLSQDCFLEETTVVFGPDDGRVVDLDVLVLLDGVDETYARRFFEKVAIAYAELDIRVVPTFQIADPPFTGDSTTDIISQARARFPGGKVPVEYDIVEVLTSKDVQALGQYAVAGQADCIGGLAYDERSYEVSEAATGIPDEGVTIGPLTFGAEYSAKITAHEMGHLLGGQHHYANCVEGIDPAGETSDVSPCTLMFNSGDIISLHFSAINAAIVRGYAVKYASANDGP
jgi:hypothetical protein